MRPRLAAIGLLCCLLPAACPSTMQRVTTVTLVPEAAPAPAQEEGVLGPTDVIEIRVFREDDLSGEYEVEANGTVNFPLVGSVPMAGLSPTDASAELTRLLEDGFLRDANVTIRVLEYNSRQVHVLGEVKQPGSFPYSDGMTIVQAITLAGGLADTGAPNRTTVTRMDADEQLVLQVPFGDISQGRAPNVPLLPEDLVFVPRSPI